MTTVHGQLLDEVAEWIARAERVVALTGAGMSAESGIATFRGGEDSLWSRYDPRQLATPQAFRADPELVWAWYMWRAAVLRRAEPHAGHRMLAWLQGVVPSMCVVTQNVDDLHERAGSRAVMHVHGELLAARCADCTAPYRAEWVEPAFADTPRPRLAPPRCAACGGAIRPGVVWFGESLPDGAWQAAVEATGSADLVLVVGTSGVVHPAAGLVELARRGGARVVEINPEASAVAGHAHHALRGTAADVLAALRGRLAG